MTIKLLNKMGQKCIFDILEKFYLLHVPKFILQIIYPYISLCELILHMYVCVCSVASVMSDSVRPCGPPGSSVHGVLQARILRSVAMLSFRDSSQRRAHTRISHVSCITGRLLPTEPPGKPSCIHVCVFTYSIKS